MKFIRENRAGGAVGAALTAFVGLCLLNPNLGQGLVNWSFDLAYALRPESRPEEVVLIYMDDESHLSLKQELNAAWNRSVHARLLNQLREYGAKAVALDILFQEKSAADPVGAAELVEAARKLGKVVLGSRYVTRGGPVGNVSEPAPPFEELRAVATWGITEGPMPQDGDFIRQQFRSQHGTNIMSLAWRLAQLTHPEALQNPLRPRWLNYYGPSDTLPWESYVRVYSNAVPASVFSNKVVFVGARIHTGYSGGKGTDEFGTPFSRWLGGKSPGVDVNATAYLNLIRDECLYRLSPVKEVLLLVLVGVVAGFGLVLLRPLACAAVAVGAMILVAVLACVLVWQYHLWFAWLIVSAVQLPCAALHSVLFNTQKIFKEKAALEARLQERPATAVTASPPLAAAPTPTLVVRELAQEIFLSPSPNPDHMPAQPPAAPSIPPLAPPIPDHILLRKIGMGAYGEVWLGRNVFDKYRAVKIVYRRSFTDRRPYEREFEGIKRFDPYTQKHTGLLNILHVGRNDQVGYFFYIMELADNAQDGTPFDPETYEACTLGLELKRRGHLPVEACIQLALTLTDSLGYLHDHGLIHRDIKPSNIIFVDGKPKLADIGLVTEAGDGLTMVGTKGFLPPEGPGSPAGDVYSLGIVLYQSLTGLSTERFPELPTGVIPDSSPSLFQGLNRIILKACETDSAKRYFSAREMHEDLSKLTGAKGGCKHGLAPVPPKTS